MALGGIGGIATGTVEQIVGYGVGGALQPILAPESTELGQAAWAERPILAVDPANAAIMVRLGWVEENWGAGEAARYGVNADRFAKMVRATRTPPSSNQLLELSRRKVIGESRLHEALLQSGMDDRYIAEYLDLLRVHLSPQDAAMARQQGFIQTDAAREIASVSGVRPDDADLLYEMSGLPLGLGEALELLRRNEIDEARFAQMVREGHTKTKYTDDALKLRWQPLSAALAAEATVRERVSHEKAQAIAAQNGLHPEDFDLYVELLGRPMGIGQALTLVRRGEMTKTQFREVVARSDVKTEYTDFLWELRTVYPPLFQLARLVTSGGITDELATEILTKEGYQPDLIKGILHNAHKSKTATTRHLSVGVIETLLNAGITTHAQADIALESLGYTHNDAEELLQVLEARRIVNEIAHGVGIVRSRYTGWKIDGLQARAEMNALDVDAETVDRLLKYWDAERDANRPTLSTSQVASAFHYGRYDYPQAIQKLQQLGWTEDDAITVLWDRDHSDPRPGNT